MTTRTAPQRSNRGSAVPAAASSAHWVAGRWALDAANSTLQISVKVGFVATVTGRFTDLHGHVDLAENLADSQIAVEVQTTSLTSGSSHWDSVLWGAGLIDSATNPTLSFESTGLSAAGSGWTLAGLLVTEKGCLPAQFNLQCVSETTDRIRFRATGSLASKDAVRLLSQPGVDRLIGKSMSVDLVVEAVRVR